MTQIGQCDCSKDAIITSEQVEKFDIKWDICTKSLLTGGNTPRRPMILNNPASVVE